jgi:hypothetical protein
LAVHCTCKLLSAMRNSSIWHVIWLHPNYSSYNATNTFTSRFFFGYDKRCTRALVKELK